MVKDDTKVFELSSRRTRSPFVEISEKQSISEFREYQQGDNRNWF